MKARKSRFSALAPAPKPAAIAAVPTPLQTVARRAAGKRNNPAYRQLTAYVKTETHQGVKLALLSDGEGREISELVDELLEGWLKARK